MAEAHGGDGRRGAGLEGVARPPALGGPLCSDCPASALSWFHAVRKRGALALTQPLRGVIGDVIALCSQPPRVERRRHMCSGPCTL